MGKVMREWVNFKVQQFNNDTYLNNVLSTMDNQTAKYQFSSSHSYLYKGESAKDFEKYLSALLKREYPFHVTVFVSFEEGNKVTCAFAFSNIRNTDNTRGFVFFTHR